MADKKLYYDKIYDFVMQCRKSGLSGKQYYIVKVTCDNLALKNDEEKGVSLINGMECQAKIIVGKKKILRYLIEKLFF